MTNLKRESIIHMSIPSIFMKTFKFYNKAFTLIELLIVIVIIGVLATALIPRLKSMQDKARYARVEKDFQDFRTVAFIAQTTTKKTLRLIVNNSCVACSCGYLGSWFGNVNFPSLPENDSCRVALRDALRKIEVAAGESTWSLSYMEKDPRWSPYLFDANEGEYWVSWDPCINQYTNSYRLSARDVFTSVWPDGRGAKLFINYLPALTWDDIAYEFPPATCPWAY